MEWQFGDDDVPVEQLQLDPPSQPIHRPPAAGRRRTWLAAFLVALAASWTTGFYLGRVHQTTATLEADIQGWLDIEAWAWKQGDWDLFRSLLPPHLPSWHLIEIRDAFHTATPEDRDLKLSYYVLSDDGTVINATVQITAHGLQYETQRTYQLVDGRWRLVNLDLYQNDLTSP